MTLERKYGMTVKELRKLLKKFPKDALVVTSDYYVDFEVKLDKLDTIRRDENRNVVFDDNGVVIDTESVVRIG